MLSPQTQNVDARQSSVPANSSDQMVQQRQMVQNPPITKSGRSIKPPTWLKDFVFLNINQDTPYCVPGEVLDFLSLNKKGTYDK